MLRGKEVSLPDWMIKGKIYIHSKGAPKRNYSRNYKTIMRFPVMLKILTAQIEEEIIYSFDYRGMFPDEEKWYLKEIKGTDGL